MPLPDPEPGLVIHYEYLWRDERHAGEERGTKRRPCAVVLAITTHRGRTEVTVAPITHAEPRFPSEGILIPPKVKRGLGLDDEPSWIIVTDLNVFDWPGVDLYPVPASPPGTYAYGFLPPTLYEQVRVRVNVLKSTEGATRRTE